MKKGITITLAQAEEHQRKHGFAAALVKSKTPVVAPKPFRGSRQPNKTEAAFGLILEARKRAGEFDTVTFEAVKLRIAGNCYYAPDWMTTVETITVPWPRVTFFECKGAHVWDDSKVKFRAAAELHKWASFEMWQRKAGEWNRIL